MGIDCKRFVQPVNRDFICSICEDVFENPVERRSCEHIFCHECITRWLSYNSICPIDRERVTGLELQEVPRVFKSLLGSLQIRCMFSEIGCSQILELGLLSAHETECPFGPSSPCPNKCGFKCGQQSSHSCVEVLKNTVHEQEVTIRQQETQIEVLRRENEELRRRDSPSRPSAAILRSPVDHSRVSRGGMSSDPDAGHREGIEKLWRKGVIKSRSVFDAMSEYNLIHFYGENAFKDGWAFGHARNLEAVIPHLSPSLTKVLVANNFSGYFQACLSSILGSSCRIFTVVDASTNGIQLLRTHYPQVLSSNRVIPITTAHAPDQASYCMIIDFSKLKVHNGSFDPLAAEGALILNPWSPNRLRQRVNNQIRHVIFFSIFGGKKYRFANHASSRPVT